MKSGNTQQMAEAIASLPVRGAWIEMLRFEHSDCLIVVAPRAGSVD